MFWFSVKLASETGPQLPASHNGGKGSIPASSGGFRGEQSSTGTGFSPSTSVIPRQFHSTNVQYSSIRLFRWDLWWTKQHWDRFFSEYFRYPPSVSLHQCSIFIYSAIQVGFVVNKAALGQVFLGVLPLSLVSFTPPMFNIHLFRWDLWRTKQHWDRFFSEYFRCPPSVSLHQCSIFIYSAIVNAIHS